MKIDEIRELIRALDESSLDSLEYSEEGMSLRLRRSAASELEYAPALTRETEQHAAGTEDQAGVQNGSVGTQTVGSGSVQAGTGDEGASGEDESSPDEVITSPLVGTFYSAPSPDEAPYVSLGDIVKKGQVLGIIEAMKLMNEVESEFSGRIAAILVENGQTVEYGQPLFRISR